MEDMQVSLNLRNKIYMLCILGMFFSPFEVVYSQEVPVVKQKNVYKIIGDFTFFYNSSHEILLVYIFHYNDSGQLKKEFYPQENITYKMRYDSFGNIISRVKYLNDRIVEEIVMKFDEKGNVIPLFIDEPGIKCYSTFSKCFYNEFNHMIMEIVYDPSTKAISYIFIYEYLYH